MLCYTMISRDFVPVLGDDVISGHINLNISLDGMHLLSESLDLCETLPQLNLDCPLQMGSHTASGPAISAPPCKYRVAQARKCVARE